MGIANPLDEGACALCHEEQLSVLARPDAFAPQLAVVLGANARVDRSGSAAGAGAPRQTGEVVPSLHAREAVLRQQGPHPGGLVVPMLQ